MRPSKKNPLKPKDLVGIPWRVAFALQADGWWLRSDIVWSKPNPLPESVRDRPTKAHEYVFLLTKRERYFWDGEAVKEAAEYGRREQPQATWNRCKVSPERVPGSTSGANPATGRNIRTVWTIPTFAFPEAHFATFPPALAERCIKAGTSERGCCPKCGAAWERVVEKSRTFESGSGKAGNLPSGKGHVSSQVRENHDIRMGPVSNSMTIGWSPGCDCGGDPIPCTVLDPFSGSGTTVLVARRLGRRGVGLDLSAEYCAMAQRRIDAEWDVSPEVEVGGRRVEQLDLIELHDEA